MLSRVDLISEAQAGVRDSIDPKKTFYVLNPSQDLKNSQKTFELEFSSL